MPRMLRIHDDLIINLDQCQSIDRLDAGPQEDGGSGVFIRFAFQARRSTMEHIDGGNFIDVLDEVEVLWRLLTGRSVPWNECRNMNIYTL